MSFQANPFVVILDANVLFPFRTRDVLLTFAQHGLFRARLTDVILDEWTTSLIKKKPHLAESVENQKRVIRNVFGECFVTGYEAIIDGLTLPDQNDRHVLAAAIRCSAQLIVTENHRDFPPSVLSEYGVETVSADDFLLNNFELSTSNALRALRAVRERYHNPPMTVSEFILDLTACGMPKLAAAARAHSEFL